MSELSVSLLFLYVYVNLSEVLPYPCIMISSDCVFLGNRQVFFYCTLSQFFVCFIGLAFLHSATIVRFSFHKKAICPISGIACCFSELVYQFINALFFSKNPIRKNYAAIACFPVLQNSSVCDLVPLLHCSFIQNNC